MAFGASGDFMEGGYLGRKGHVGGQQQRMLPLDSVRELVCAAWTGGAGRVGKGDPMVFTLVEVARLRVAME